MVWVLDCPNLPEAGNLSPGMAERWTNVAQVLDQAATNERVPLDLLTAIAFVESRWNPFVTSSANAQGLMQVIPSTGRYVADRIGVVWQPWDPEINAMVGAAYLRMLLNRWNGRPVDWAIASYFAGGGNVSKYGPAKYDHYVEAVKQARRAVNDTRTRCQQGGGGNVPRWTRRGSGKATGGGATKKHAPPYEGPPERAPSEAGGGGLLLIFGLLLLGAAR